MPNIEVPADRDPMIFLWSERAGPVGSAAAKFSNTAYYASTLSPREFEIVRMRIAQINDCRVCQTFRAPRDVVGRFDEGSVPEDVYEHVGDPTWSGFSDRERLAMEFTERFALDHLAMSQDAAFWDRLHEHYTDDELVELACCAGAHLVNGRINRVFDVEGDCSIRQVVQYPDRGRGRDRPLMDDEARVNELLDKLLAEHDPKTEPVEEFLGAQFDYGLAFVHFPEGHGGLGVAPRLQQVVNQRIAAVGAPVGAARNAIGFGMGAPTIVTHGTEEQKRKYLRPLFTGEEMWCQLFSEPGAGSDVAGLSTRADRDGDEWIVNGQKVWTSLAHFAKWGLLVARTNPDVEKHKGLTYFVLDMDQPGVEVRPLRQMTGGAEFNEVYFTNARVPDENRLGDIGAGWSTVVTTLMNERVFIGGGIAPRGAGMIQTAVKLWQSSGRKDPAMRERLMQLYTRAETVRLTNARAQQKRAVGNPGPEGSIGKLANAELNQAIGELCVDLMGPEGMLFDTYETSRERVMAGRPVDPRAMFLRSRANTIEGGTSEVMRNILGERVLGLPGDVRVDRGVAWKDVPRN